MRYPTLFLLVLYSNIILSGPLTINLFLKTHIGDPVPNAVVLIGSYKSVSNNLGECVFTLEQGSYGIRISHPSYQRDNFRLYLSIDTSFTVYLTPYELLDAASVRANIGVGTSTLSSVVKSEEYIKTRAENSLMTTLSNLAGVNAIEIGQGFSKPMIRGLAFNRVAVIENNVKQQGQQWGADHGLEIDQMNVDKIEIIKGPASLEYGSDAIGGIVLISPQKIYTEGVTTSLLLNTRSNNALLGGSLGIHYRKSNKYIRTRLTYQNYGDYKVPADSFTYLNYVLPIHGGYLKNTAGFERSVNILGGIEREKWDYRLSISNVYSKMGFFAGAHGLPSSNKLQDDGNRRNIDYPYQTVNHFKVISNSIYHQANRKLYLDFSYQNNLRKEYSIPHTHGSKPFIPGNLELEMNLHTFSAITKLEVQQNKLQYTLGQNTEYQQNIIDGYSFLLPRFNQLNTGIFIHTDYMFSQKLRFCGGLRLDYGRIHLNQFIDTTVSKSYQRAPELNNSYWDYSFSSGISYFPNSNIGLKLNIGKSFRMPTANELGSNGVHHGTFRYELGDSLLLSEKSYQLDLGFEIGSGKRIAFSVNGFYNYFPNFIFLEPTGKYSLIGNTGEIINLPDVGQIYKYTQAEAIRFGGEASLRFNFAKWLGYESNAEYVYAKNVETKHPIPFTPPLSIRNEVQFKVSKFKLIVNQRYNAPQNRVRNELKTPSSLIYNTTLFAKTSNKKNELVLTFGIQNILNTRYYNHLSFYRFLNLPEQGRNFTFTLLYTIN